MISAALVLSLFASTVSQTATSDTPRSSFVVVGEVRVHYLDWGGKGAHLSSSFPEGASHR